MVLIVIIMNSLLFINNRSANDYIDLFYYVFTLAILNDDGYKVLLIINFNI